MTMTGRELGVWVAAGVLAAALAGCNASANLDAVQAGKAKAVQRFDQFQGVATNGKVVVAVAGNGTVAVSDDGARSWRRKSLDPDAALVGVAACPDGSFAAVDFHRRLWLGEASGARWRAQSLTTKANTLAVVCDAGNALWVVGTFSTILSSADRGQSWHERSLGEDAMLTTVQFVGERRGVITGEFGAVYVSDDAGATWTAGQRIANDILPLAAHFKDAATGWVSAAGGVILRRAADGAWVRQNNPAGVPIYGFVEHGGELLGVGANAAVLRLAGEDWIPVEHGKHAPYIRAALSLPDRRLLLAGGAGLLDAVTLDPGK